MDEADMFVDSDGSSLEYVPEYEDYGSCSIGTYTMDQFDGAVTDDDSSSDD